MMVKRTLQEHGRRKCPRPPERAPICSLVMMQGWRCRQRKRRSPRGCGKHQQSSHCRCRPSRLASNPLEPSVAKSEASSRHPHAHSGTDLPGPLPPKQDPRLRSQQPSKPWTTSQGTTAVWRVWARRRRSCPRFPHRHRQHRPQRQADPSMQRNSPNQPIAPVLVHCAWQA